MAQNTQQDTKPKTSVVTKITSLGSGAMKQMSALLSRTLLASRAGLRFDGQRDYYAAFGYKRALRYEDYLGKYQRQDIVSRIIDAPPGATWSNPPTFKSVKLQTAWDELDKKHALWSKLQRVDRLARLGNYAVLIFGFSKSRLENPLRNGDNGDLLYIRPFSMGTVRNIVIESNQTDKRFGTPAMYKLSAPSDDTRNIITPTSTTHTIVEQNVHHSHVVHVVENALEDEIFGTPVIERAFNLLDDLLKVSGGSAEMFWLIANRGMHIDIDKDMSLTAEDEADLSDEVEEYMDNLRRFIRTRGVKIKNLGADTIDPSGVFDMQISLLAGVTGIPKRILVGAEAGQLASEQDRANWAERIEERSILYAEPQILRPTVELLQFAGVLPDAEVEIVWPTAFKMSPLEKSEVMAQTARAVGNLSRQTGNQTPMQLTSRTEARELIGLEGDLPDSDLIEPTSPPTPPPTTVPPAADGDAPSGTPGN